jgi:hypothetical protein
MKERPNDRMEPVRAHNEVSTLLPAIGEADLDPGVVLIEANASGTAVDSLGVN